MQLNTINYRHITLLVCCLLPGLLASAQAPVNSIRIRSPRTKIGSNLKLDSLTGNKDSVNVTYQYLDGLGRPVQTVQQQGSPTGRDIVQPIAYDRFGRELVKYLPYTINSRARGSYRPNALNQLDSTASEQYQFYQQTGQGYVNTLFPYAGTVYEPSPLNRVIEQGAPGQSWQTGGGHTVRMEHASNDQSGFNDTLLVNNPGCRRVVLYTTAINADQSQLILSSPVATTYATGELYLTISKDENWNAATDGCVGTTEEYKDKEGRVVCKRTYNQIDSLVEMLSTYYVYDDLGRLAFVFPPAANPDNGRRVRQVTLDNYCYQYRYDERNRMTQKKLPGKGWEYMLYNDMDKVVATQDSMQRAQHKWRYTKYDALGRTTMTGIYSDDVDTTRTGLQAKVNSIAALWEIPQQGDSTGYSHNTWPVDSVSLLTANYYDSYHNITNLPSMYSAPVNASTATTGLLVASTAVVLEHPADKLMKVFYYDDLGRIAKSYAQHYFNFSVGSNNYDAYTNTYNFTDAVTATLRQHSQLNGDSTLSAMTITNEYGYDHMGRKIENWETVTSDSGATPRTLISQLDYNELGQMMTKHLGSTDSINFLQDVNYAYNERGWLKQNSSDLFHEKLQYNQAAGTINGVATTPQFNGNIASESWETDGSPEAFAYSYDRLNRLTAGIQDTSFAERNITYDQAGNIQTLSRVYNGNLIDSLAYGYNGTNHLQQVQDFSADNSSKGYLSGTHGYAYDGNGNMIADSSKNMTVAYNILNQPATVNAGIYSYPSQQTLYYHDANGEKLARYYLNEDVGPKGEFDFSFYDDGLQYDINRATFSTQQNVFLQTEEGRVFPYSTDSTNYYQYYLTDHLGNTRIAFDTPKDTLKVEQQDDYMPFGMEISKLNISTPKNEYLYNKKELQENTQLYDYGARFYDPVIARWTGVDPLAEMSRRWSPYNYCLDNSISLVDPDGMKVDSASRPEWDRQKQAVTNQRNNLSTGIDDLNSLSQSTGADLSGLISGLQERVTSLNGTLNNLTNLENSSQMYGLNAGAGEVGGTTLNTHTNTIIFSFSTTANFVHETTHGGQFEAGEIAFTANGKLVGQDVNDEISAYKAQFAFDPASISGLRSSSTANSFSDITTSWVQGITTLTGDRLYSPGGTANTGVSPVNINSNKADLIRAYPNLAGQLQSLPANFTLKSIPGLYYNIKMKKKYIFFFLLLTSCAASRFIPGNYYNNGTDYKKSLNLNKDGTFVLILEDFDSKSRCQGKWRHLTKDTLLLKCDTESFPAIITSGNMSEKEQTVVLLSNNKIKYNQIILTRH